ncbi:hypothetical protein [Dyadobacter psychrotolerans]|uniref:Uncharacterized protein n=1 Tax=Dyadobacter psychrotolerans TaxID=2541721 RepID=A0A4R5DE64_9BACT|nr:hypothetical protein [Dyadobacter psychrotolerans]TDE11367.1 hypothetical protein E0F88_26010 [Dyadobacter psychrotolerans]
MLVDIKGTPSGFITRDLHFCMTGDIRKVKSSKGYNTYKNEFPKNNGQLFRFNKVKSYWHFWRYAEYLFDPNWQADYLDLPENFSTERYYGSYIDEHPLYTWDTKRKNWVHR